MAIDREILIGMFRVMVRTRCLEERSAKEYRDGHIPGNIHLAIGQEAIAAGVGAALRSDDYLLTQHRAHGHALAKGVTPERLMAEFYGKRNGCCMGRVGPLHIGDADLNYFGGQGIVGSQVPIATGVALSAKMRGTDQVTLCHLGEGTTNTGRFHTAINLASIWNLPVVYLIENNMWAYGVCASHSANIENLSDRAIAYGIPGMTVDGNDAISVYEAVSKAVARARTGEGPSIVECKTLRLDGHYSADTQVYRDKTELEEGWKREPIKRFREQLIATGVLTEKEADQINQEALAEMDRAVKFAEESPFPDFKEALGDFYTDEVKK
jgi:pyruvate dehydrogenase E1 component alpha subunit